MKAHHTVAQASSETPQLRQRIFIRYYVAISADLIVLGLLSQYWSQVSIANFSSGLIAAVLLQLMLQITVVSEHYAAKPFTGKTGSIWLAARLFTTWLILFVSKLIMLWAVGWVLGDDIIFLGAVHGALAFIVTVIAMVVLEMLMFSLYGWLGKGTTGISDG